MAEIDDTTKTPPAPPVAPPVVPPAASPEPEAPPMPAEIGGPKGPEPTRYGDWERKGRVSDF
ncbi:DUF1674 domain-containing protein [Roseomonas populi]|uniref:DUF1674 domain-containing protein n=1 Tax=Roseomonas populi TaxID=3121582 RepID=A0ABT1X9Z4_9PROT|nr:succinate dehydrogenase assembly factor 4 [Roseomonas pecuniae]MCR0984586.1 DUF1674 domain-containing protein [Roseomonas pecuniae]